MKTKKKKKKQRKKWTRIFFCSFVTYREKSVSGSADANSKVFHRESPLEQLWRSSWTRFNSLDTNSFPFPNVAAPLFANLLVSRSLLPYPLSTFHSPSFLPPFFLILDKKRLLISRCINLLVEYHRFAPRTLSLLLDDRGLDEIFIGSRWKTEEVTWQARKNQFRSPVRQIVI